MRERERERERNKQPFLFRKIYIEWDRENDKFIVTEWDKKRQNKKKRTG